MKVVVIGWKYPTVTNVAGKVSQKLEISYTEASPENSCALNAIFNEVDKNVFKLFNSLGRYI